MGEKMRCFRIHEDKKNLAPRFLNWFSQIGAGQSDEQVYERLEGKKRFLVELNREVEFMDIIYRPCFMVSKEFANLIRIYSPETRFQYIHLFDEKNHRIVYYQVPGLPLVDCLDDRSELSRDRSEVIKGIIKAEKIKGYNIFRLGGVNGGHIMASLEFVESAYRREVTGMRIEEFMVK